MGTRRQIYTTCSVVMAVYKNDRPDWFMKSIESILAQTMKSDDIIVVVDGPISVKLGEIIDIYDRLYQELTVIRLAENRGLANALNVGIAQAKNDLVARMDSDDISVRNRFERQLTVFNTERDVSILGGQVIEFDGAVGNVISRRSVPLAHDEITLFARRRAPFNHPTVMYSKRSIQLLGGYRLSLRSEDYDLWLRASVNGLRMKNLPEELVYFRMDSDAMKRRKSFSAVKDKVRTSYLAYKEGMIGMSDLAYNTVMTVGPFFLPTRVARWLRGLLFEGRRHVRR